MLSDEIGNLQDIDCLDSRNKKDAAFISKQPFTEDKMFVT
jgi:hypothetical protein